jgi:hypothetical protein
MGKKSGPPPAPDYTGAAEKTAASNQDAQTRADWANRPNQVTPFGSQTWDSSAMVDPATGKPVTSWTQTTQVAPELMKGLQEQQQLQTGRSELAGSMMGRMQGDYEKPYDWSGMTPMGEVPTAGATDATRQRVEQGLMERMRPENEFQSQGLETQLANQGFTRGSQGWNRAKQQLQESQDRQKFQALEQGGAEASRQFGMQQQSAEYANKVRQQQIAEQMQRRGMSLNEINAILSGQQVSMPNMPTFNTSTSAGGVNYSGAAKDQYSAGMDAYNAKQQQAQSTMSGIGQVAGMAGMMMMSDIRLKSNIVRVGTHPLGVGIYEYDIQGRRERGVIAQEVMKVRPDLVHEHVSGYLMVDYGGLQ